MGRHMGQGNNDQAQQFGGRSKPETTETGSKIDSHLQNGSDRPWGRAARTREGARGADLEPGLVLCLLLAALCRLGSPGPGTGLSVSICRTGHGEGRVMGKDGRWGRTGDGEGRPLTPGIWERAALRGQTDAPARTQAPAPHA